MILATLPAVSQVQGASVYGDVCIKAAEDDFANAHGHSSIGFNPAIYSIPDKPFTATRVYTFRRIRPEEFNAQGHFSRSSDSTPAPDLSEEVIVARDKAGRVHYETRAPAKGEIAVMIYDPVVHTLSQYYLAPDRGMPDDAVAKVTYFQLMSKLSRPIAATPPNETSDPPADSVPQPDSSSSSPVAAPSSVAAPKNIDPPFKDLPEQSINGIPVVGRRMVHKYGDKNQYLQIVEDWLSPEYLVNLRDDIVRESIGESTIETRDLVDGEPDPSLFHVPGGYLIRKSK
ncbi:MAG: hypothetical protein ACLPVW_03475 [Terriglobales bacterium]